MSGVQMPKWKSYTMPSWELNHIARDPPKSIHTRKKERVEMGDVTYMIRNDDSRINEGVNYLARGVNPMVDVMYNNVGGGGGGKTNTMANIQASNPYKVMNVRPPMFTQEDLLPLSRQRRPETSAITNPGIRSGFNINNLMDQTDRQEIKTAINKEKLNYIAVRPTAMYRMELPSEVFSNGIFSSNAINKDKINVAAVSGLVGNQDYNTSRDMITNIPLQAGKDARNTTASSNINRLENIDRNDNIDENNYIKDNVILKDIKPNFSVLLYDPGNKNYSEVFGSIKDKINIAVQSSLNRPIDLTREDGTPIKLKDYRWKVVYSAVSNDKLVLQPINSPDFELERNLPLYAAGTNISGNTKEERIHLSDPIMDNKIKTSVGSSVSMNYGKKESIYNDERNIKLRGLGSIGGFRENFGTIPTTDLHNIPTLTSKKMDVKQLAAQAASERYP